MTIRKFYNADAAEAVASTTPEVVETPLEQPSLASLMAKSGVVNDGSSTVEIPINKENIEKPTETQPETTAIVKEEKVEVIEETPIAENPVVQQANPQNEKPAEPVVLWQDVAKSQPNDVLKALGANDEVVNLFHELKEVDQKMVAFLNVWKSGGDVTGYLRELTTDYTKLSAEEVMRHHIRQSYPKADEKQLEILYRTKVVNAYNLNSEDPDELEEGRLLLEAEAEQYRDKYIESQKQFLLPKPQEPKPVVPDNSLQEKQAEAERQFNESYRNQVESNSLTKNIFATKFLTVGEGEQKFNFPVEPAEVIDVLYNNDGKFTEAMWEKALDEKGNQTLKPKVEHQLLVATVAKYGTSFIDKLKDHYTSLGANKVIAPLDNAKLPETATASQPGSAPKTAAEAMAMKGRVVSGGN